jgi:hypothetical protein
VSSYPSGSGYRVVSERKRDGKVDFSAPEILVLLPKINRFSAFDGGNLQLFE